MAARKLQTEIDRTLKKVAEGVEQFEDLYKKIQQTNNFTHKEKQEAELKTQIKKLQRLRDQIKTWLASNEIKDKKALTDNRKLIELQMERFKACEKEMKTKAFSKEGLSAGHKLDPKEQLKAETANFVSAQVEELARQVETTEAEIELLQGGAKKSKKSGGSGQDKISQLEDLNDRRAWHISRLELILRLIENGNLDPDRIVSLKEDIGYFVESNTEEDFEEDEGIYDELNLDEEEEAFGLADKDDIQSSHDSMSVADVSDIVSYAPPVRTPAKATPKASASSAVEGDGEKSPTATKVTKRKPTLDGTAQRPTGLNASARSVSGTTTSTTSNPAPTTVQSPAAAPPASGPAPRAVPAQLPPIRYSAAAASAVAAQSPTPAAASSQSKEPSIQSVSSPSAASSTTQPLSAAQVASPSAILSPGAGLPAAPATQTASETSTAAKVQSPQVAKAQVPTQATPAATDASPSPAPSHASIPQSANKGVSPSPGLAPRSIDTTSQLSPSQQAASIAPLQALELGSQTQQQSITPGTTPGESQADSNVGLPMASPAISGLPSPGQLPQGEDLAGQQGQSEPRLPSSLADLVTSFENAKQKSIRRDNNLGAVNEILEAGYPNIPQAADAEKPRYYVPRNAYPTPHYYPQQPTPHHANPSMFSKFDIDTLFYIFYYCQGTYMQYLAAQELKKQSWRFHKQYLTWFQRANEPQMITDEFEQGVYLYFDFEGSWAQRRKENFTFFYRHLEE